VWSVRLVSRATPKVMTEQKTQTMPKPINKFLLRRHQEGHLIDRPCIVGPPPPHRSPFILGGSWRAVSLGGGVCVCCCRRCRLLLLLLLLSVLGETAMRCCCVHAKTTHLLPALDLGLDQQQPIDQMRAKHHHPSSPHTPCDNRQAPAPRANGPTHPPPRPPFDQPNQQTMVRARTRHQAPGNSSTW
jgi:hypothetical protein